MVRKRSMRWSSPVLLLILLLVGLWPWPAQAIDTTVTRQVMRSVVQIIAVEEGSGGQLYRIWTGSGTIVSEDGLILTNCHVAFPEAMWGSSYAHDGLVVALTGRSDEPPEPTYFAEVVQYDPNLDLAVIRITRTLDGNPVDPEELNLPALPLADSDQIEIGEDLYIFGYPGIGGETITFTRGSVSGFNSERGVEGRAWIKTDATIAGGNSGGTGVNEAGELLGVPTQGGAGNTEDIVDCRYIADTNGDGRIDENDNCVPMGGFINALRPVNLARPLIEAASLGLGPQPDPTPRPQPSPPSGDARIARPLFAPAVNPYDQPVTVVQSFPSGTEEIYLFFDYEDFQDGAAWLPELSIDGQAEEGLWPLSPWNGGTEGTWWISVSGSPLANGTYDFVLSLDGETAGTASVTVGGTAASQPTFSDVVFSGGGEEGYWLPGGIHEIEAEVSYAHMTSATGWSYLWYYDGEEVADGEGPALSRSSGSTSLSLSSRQGFEAGTYRLELYVGQRLAATSDVIVGVDTTGDGGGQVFGPITFAEGVDRQGNPVDAGSEFESGISELYAFFDYSGMQDNWEWTRRWSIDGEIVVDADEIWSSGESGEDFWVSIYSSDVLPDGEYQLELLLEGQVVQVGTCRIGEAGSGGPKPADGEGGVEIYGTISDADTGRGIYGAVFLVLQPGITVDAFGWTDEEVYAYGEADGTGYYELSEPLVRGEVYSILVGAQGYLVISEDGVTIPDDMESPYQLDITLQRSR